MGENTVPLPFPNVQIVEEWGGEDLNRLVPFEFSRTIDGCPQKMVFTGTGQ
jgi:hypothetical protein